MFTELLFFISDRFLNPEVFWGTPILLAIVYAMILLQQKINTERQTESKAHNHD
jgi:hypothetical protein